MVVSNEKELVNVYCNTIFQHSPDDLQKTT